MSNKLKGMIWLRGQVTLANKSILLQVLMPVFFVFLYKFIFFTEWSGSRTESRQTSYLVNEYFFALLFSHVCWDTHYYHLS